MKPLLHWPSPAMVSVLSPSIGIGSTGKIAHGSTDIHHGQRDSQASTPRQCCTPPLLPLALMMESADTLQCWYSLLLSHTSKLAFFAAVEAPQPSEARDDILTA
jgi:hypothetical protein